MNADQRWLTTTSPNVAGTITVEREVMINALRDQGFVVEERAKMVAGIAAAIRTDMILRHAEMFQKARETADLAIRTVEKNRDVELPD